MKHSAIHELKETSAIFTSESATHKKQLLLECENIPLNSKKVIEQYHDCLIFLLGYLKIYILKGEVL